jgi:dephospho-CoA kinase
VASGKGVVAGRFASRGVPVINADDLAREALARGGAGLRSVVERFGASVLAQDGNLDRGALAQLVFHDRTALEALNAIVHPIVGELLRERLKTLEEQGVSLACYEVPLLFENGLQALFHPVVLVAASAETQVQRAMARSGWTAEQARARVAAQWPLAEKRKLADFVIDNDGALELTLSRADEVLDAVRATVQSS